MMMESRPKLVGNYYQTTVTSHGVGHYSHFYEERGKYGDMM